MVNNLNKFLLAAMILVFVLTFSVQMLPVANSQEEVPLYGGTLVVGNYADPQSFLPVRLNIEDWPAQGPIFNSLITHDMQMNPKPELARSWIISADGKTITFDLVRNATWHDGSPFTSADVKFSIEELYQKLSEAKDIYSLIESVQIPDSYTVVFNMSNPSALLFKVLGPFAGKIIPKHIYEGTDLLANPANENPIGTGPFKFVEWVKGSHITLEKNPNYWKSGKPYLDRIVINVIPSLATRLMALETGEVDVLPMVDLSSEVDRLSKTPGFKVDYVSSEVWVSYGHLTFNLRNPPLSDVRVRYAIAHALDKDLLNQVVLQGLGRPAEVPIPGDHPYYNEAMETYPYNITEANRLLDEAGYPKGSDDMRFKLRLLVTEYSFLVPQAEAAKEQLRDVGIEIEIVNRELGVWMKEVFEDFDFDIVSSATSFKFDPLVAIDLSLKESQIGIPFGNPGGYINAELEVLTNEALKEIDEQERIELAYQIQEIMAEDLPIIWLFDAPRVTAYNAMNFRNLPMGPWIFSENVDSVWWIEGSLPPSPTPTPTPTPTPSPSPQPGQSGPPGPQGPPGSPGEPAPVTYLIVSIALSIIAIIISIYAVIRKPS